MTSVYTEKNWYLEEYDEIKRDSLESTLEFLQKLLIEAEQGKIDFLVNYYDSHYEWGDENNIQDYMTPIFIVLDSLAYIFDSMKYWTEYNLKEKTVNSILDILDKLYNLYIRSNIYIEDRYRCREYIEKILSYVLGNIFYRDDWSRIYTGNVFYQQSWRMHQPIIILVIKLTGQIMIDLASTGENPYVSHLDGHEYGDEKTLSSIPDVRITEYHVNEARDEYYKWTVLDEISVIVNQVKTAYEKYLENVNIEVDNYLIPDLAGIVFEYLPNEENTRPEEEEEYDEEYDEVVM